MSDVVIKAENLSKYYRLGVINNGTLFRDIQTWWALKRGKEDPHSRLGEHKYDSTKEGFWALKDLNFEIKQGDRVGIIGKNGAGKSTLLKVLSRITAPTEGSVKLKGRVSSLLEVGTGFHGELTGRENIYLNGAILGMKRAEVTRKMDDIVAFSGIEQHIDTPVKRYSSGMYVRLAFAVAAHLDSEILIADEVLAVGDAEFQKKALGKMNELSTGQGRTVLFVSHNMSQIKALCNKGIVLEKGAVVRQDSNINDSIGWYLGTETKENKLKSLAWYNNDDFYNENFCPKSLEIIDKDENVVSDNLSYEKEYKIRLKFDSDMPDRNVNFWLPIYIGTERIFSLEMPKDFKCKKGENIIEYTIPPRTFLPNRYMLTIGSSVKNVKWILKPDEFQILLSFIVLATDCFNISSK